MTKVSVIVLCWNHCEDLTIPFVQNFLETTSFAENNCELILFNNGSTDGTKKYLDSLEFDDCIKVIHSGTNLGFGGGNNKALEKASGEYVLFLNNDVKIHDKNWLRKLLEEAGENKFVGAQFVDGNSATEFRHMMRPYLNGWCLMVPRSFLNQFGGFSPDFGLGYFEDVELCQRAMANAYVLKEVKIEVEHLGSKSSNDQLDISDQFLFNRLVYRNLMYNHEKGKKLRIVFFCPGMYPFTDSDYEGKGVGGAEASLILLTRELAKLGFVVDIYNSTEVEGNFGGVNYINLANFVYTDYSDIFVLFRNSMLGLEAVNSPLKLFWSCDQETTRDWEFEVIPYIDRVIAISPYHKKYLVEHHPISEDIIDVVDLGIKESDYIKEPQKVKQKMIFCSVPKRGLENLVRIYFRIKEKFPESSLVITSDYRLWGAEPLNEEFRAKFQNMPGVTFLGKVDRSELVKHQLESEIMAYPCNYDENFCISAMECIAAGAVPITTSIGALPTTVADSGIIIKGDPATQPYLDKFLEAVTNFFVNQEKLDAIRREGRNRALKLYTWSYLAKEQWDKRLKKLLATKMTTYKPNYCDKCKEQFSNAFEFVKHKTKSHPIESKKANYYPEAPKIEVLIKTSRGIELDIGGRRWNGTELKVPQEMASDVVRILNEAYGQGIIIDTKMDVIT